MPETDLLIASRTLYHKIVEKILKFSDEYKKIEESLPPVLRPVQQAICLAEPENGNSVRGKRIGKRIRKTVAFLFSGTRRESMFSTLIKTVAAVKQQVVYGGFRYTYPVIRPLHGSKIDNKQKVLFSCFIPANEAENAPVSVVGVDPLESAAVPVQTVKSRMFFIKSEKIPAEFLKFSV